MNRNDRKCSISLQAKSTSRSDLKSLRLFWFYMEQRIAFDIGAVAAIILLWNEMMQHNVFAVGGYAFLTAIFLFGSHLCFREIKAIK